MYKELIFWLILYSVLLIITYSKVVEKLINKVMLNVLVTAYLDMMVVMEAMEKKDES